jgi:hypothetical protein
MILWSISTSHKYGLSKPLHIWQLLKHYNINRMEPVSSRRSCMCTKAYTIHVFIFPVHRRKTFSSKCYEDLCSFINFVKLESFNQLGLSSFKRQISSPFSAAWASFFYLQHMSYYSIREFDLIPNIASTALIILIRLIIHLIRERIHTFA